MQLRSHPFWLAHSSATFLPPKKPNNRLPAPIEHYSQKFEPEVPDTDCTNRGFWVIFYGLAEPRV